MKEGNVLFNNALSNMVKDHTGSEKGNKLLPLHGQLHALLFQSAARDLLYVPYHTTDRLVHSKAFVIPVMQHSLK